MIAIKGEYEITQNGKSIIRSTNLITQIGESFFLNRWVNDEFDSINRIMLGKGTTRPLKSDSALGNLTTIKQSKYSIDLKNKKIILSCDCKPSEILGTSEIGVGNGEILVSHDIYETITEELLENDTSSNVHIDYAFNLVTGSLRSNWILSNNGESTYYVYEPNEIIGVVVNGKSFEAKNSLGELVFGSFFYDRNSKNLYIKLNLDPNGQEIIIQSR
ncbi:MAG: hypothetical protein Q4P18_07300 [Methanobrevibacter sp.]|uniref:hypothetical protein n=1 Tax=Methanobrevibacter sp. TaxID=66852 RepID=UPI0026E05BB0|nr:hypothetical protein [Methanobrevibacter sp.]MDO5849324.1 hypothetical protein [Methanobrevibacter sp.]